MKAYLKKFEPLEDGTITITLKADGDSMQECVALYRQNVTIDKQGMDVPTINAPVVYNSLCNINLIIKSLLNTIAPEKEPIYFAMQDPDMNNNPDSETPTFLSAAGG